MLNNQTSNLIVTWVIIKFLYLILTPNNFIFNSINYLQINVRAMGTVCILHMPNFSWVFWKNVIYIIYTHIYTLVLEIFQLSTVNLWTIVFVMDWNGIWTNLIYSFNKKHPTIKFESTTFWNQHHFFVYENRKSKCNTMQQYLQKLNDCCNYLHYKWAHPKSLKHSIPFSQALHKTNLLWNIGSE